MSGTRSGGRGRALRLPRIVVPGAALVMGAALLGLGGTVAAQYSETPGGSIAPASIAPASMAPGSAAPTGAAIPVTLADFSVTPNPMGAAGTAVTFDVINQGPTPHNLTIRDAAGTVLGASQTLSTGGTESVTITFPAPGEYITFCSLPGHESLGLKGVLVVTAADPLASPATPPIASPAASPAA